MLGMGEATAITMQPMDITMIASVTVVIVAALKFQESPAMERAPPAWWMSK